MFESIGGRRVFVSGGAGVIGLELVPKLVNSGAQVMVGDLKPRPSNFEDNVIYVEGDLNDLVQAQFNEFAPEVFIHLAATFERSTETIGFWNENFRNNILLSHHLMDIARKCPSLQRVVFASSYLIYDQDLYQFGAPSNSAVKLNETHPISPRNLTGMAKLAHETELNYLSAFKEYGFTSVCARIFRGYGRNSRDVISRWVRSLIAGEPITVYRPEGLFDYTYAADSAEGLIRLAFAENAEGIVNLGTGHAHRVAEVVEILRGHFPSAVIEYAESDILFEASEADTSKLRALLDWTPEYDLPSAIGEIIAFEKKRSEIESKQSVSVSGNVLITSASGKVPLLRAMRNAANKVNTNIELVAGDIDSKVPTKHIADKFWQMPRSQAECVSEILAGCTSRKIRAILPTRDEELMFWAENRLSFAQNDIDVIISSPESVGLCLDKLSFANFGIDKGLPFIPCAINAEDLECDRFVVKERFGSGSQNIGINLDRTAANDFASRIENPIFQPFVEGPEISIDSWVDRDGVPAGVVLRRRDRIVNGESQSTTTFRNPDIEEEASRILELLCLYGPVVMQAIVIDDRKLAIIEVNPRFGGASTASINVGLDSLYWSLVPTFCTSNRKTCFKRANSEVQQVRIASDILIHDHSF